MPLVLVTEIPTPIFLFNKIQMKFIWKGKKLKIKHSTLCNEYENGTLKNVDVFTKVVILQCSWINKLFDNNFHQWKVIQLYLCYWYLMRNFKFHSNLEISRSVLWAFLNFIKSYFLDGVNVFLLQLHYHLNLNFVGWIFDFDVSIKSWECLKDQFQLKNNMQSQFWPI